MGSPRPRTNRKKAEPAANPLLEVFTSAADMQAGFANPRHEFDLADILREMFNEAVMDLPEGELSEEQANDMVAQRVIGLLDQAFKAGMLYYGNYVEPESDRRRKYRAPDEITISPQDATAIVNGLFGDGFAIRVERRG